jgi:transposase
MRAKSYPTDLTDVEWDFIKDLIPPPKSGGRKRELDIRGVVNAIFYVVDGGIKWRMLPHEYPNYNSVYWYFSQWRERGDWQGIHDTLRAKFVKKKTAISILPPAVWTLKVSRPRKWAVNVASTMAKTSKVANVIYWLTRWACC